MLLGDFAHDVLVSEEACLAFLRKHGIFGEAVMFCNRNPTGQHECGGEMKLTTRMNVKKERIPTWRCTACYTYRSVRSKFFSWDVHSNLSLHDIMTLLYLWLYNTNTIKQVYTMAGHSCNTIVNWFFCFRQVCGDALRHAPPLVGTNDSPNKLDESYFSARRKNRRRRKLAWDRT